MSERPRARVPLLGALVTVLALLCVAPALGTPGRAAARATKTTTTATRTTATTTTATTTTTTTTTFTTTKAVTAKKPAKKPAPIAPLGGSLGSATFPSRTLVLSVPYKTLSAGQVHVSENGTAVSNLTVTPLSQANAGDFGVVLVIDQSPSMTGAPLAQAMTAARVLAAQRSGQQELGVITFDGTANVTLPLTSDAQQINTALAVTPWIGPGTRILPALLLALEQLSQARIAAGAVILLSDGGDREHGSKVTAQQVAAAAHAMGVPIYTVGLKDRYYSPRSLQAIATAAGGKFLQANGSELAHNFTLIDAELSGRYLVRYRSSLSPGTPVSVSARVDGVPGSVAGSYVAPVRAVPHPAARIVHHPAARRRPSIAGAAKPSFAQPAPPLPATATPRSFWSSSLGMLVAAAAAALFIGLGIAVLLVRYPARLQAVQTRVGSFIPGPGGAVVAGLGEPSHGLLGKLLQRRSFWPRFVEDVAVARMSHSPVSLVKRYAAFAAIAALFFIFVLGSALIGILALVIWPFILFGVVRRGARRQRAKFNDELPSHLQDLGGSMRAGRSFVGGFAAVAESADEPIRGEFERVVTDEQLGRPLEESLTAMAVRMQADDMHQVALIAALHRRSGSNVAEALDRVAEGARENADLRRELKALTGQAKLSSWVLTGLPVMLLIGISVIAPKYAHPLFHTTTGLILVGVSAVMVFSGWRVMNRIINVKV